MHKIPNRRNFVPPLLDLRDSRNSPVAPSVWRMPALQSVVMPRFIYLRAFAFPFGVTKSDLSRANLPTYTGTF